MAERTFSPLSLALDAQREATEAAGEVLDKSTVAPERLATLQNVDVGQTPSEVVYTENKLELLHYEPLTEEQHDVPILVIYALINRPYILDLQPDRSVVRRLLEAGHDVYLIDWNEPSRLDKHLTLEDYVTRYIDNCVDVVRERSGQDDINILGYCMGGTMSAMYAALEPEKVRTLGLMAAGLCFANTGGVLEEWGDDAYYDPRDVTETFDNMPAEMLDVGFALMDPVSNYVSKYVRLFDNLENEDFVANFARMEKWLSEGIDVAGEAYVEFLEDIYQDNKLHNNELYLGDRHVDVTNIDVPVLQVLGEYDHLIPPTSSKPFNEVVGSDDVTTIEYPTGHIGLSVSGSSHRDVWPEVAEWYHEKSAAAGGSGEASAGSEAAPADEGPPTGVESADGDVDVEAVDGIGPTYAERLRAAGIETVADLAESDAAAVADAAEVGPARAEDWVEQARSGDVTVPEAESTADEPAEPATDGTAEEPSGAADEATPGDADVEAVDGIGPTYAERLRAAGIETVADLAESDAAAVADAAEVGPARAEDWVEQARA